MSPGRFLLFISRIHYSILLHNEHYRSSNLLARRLADNLPKPEKHGFDQVADVELTTLRLLFRFADWHTDNTLRTFPLNRRLSDGCALQNRGPYCNSGSLNDHLSWK